jgi:hypothetical protein
VRNILGTPPGVTTAESFFPPSLSTPVAYVTTAQIPDPFVSGGIPIPTNDQIYRTLFYQNVVTSINAATGMGSGTTPYRNQLLSESQIAAAKSLQGWGVQPAGTPSGSTWLTVYGFWKMGSLGPDRDYSGGSAGLYDPTNGTVSQGDIYRTQLRPEGGRQNYGF